MNAKSTQYIEVFSATDASRLHAIPLPPSDIDACINFSKFRCLLCIFSVLLVCSDIPRTGLGIKRVADIMPLTEPGSGVYFGPHSFPIATILKVPKVPSGTGNTSFRFIGTCDGTVITSENEWALKKSTLSIAIRGLVRMLHLEAAWSPCMLYHKPCSTVKVDLHSAFSMLDAVVIAVHQGLFPNQQVGTRTRSFAYLTKNRWIDRVHHYVLLLVGWAREQTRLNSVNYYQVSGQNTLNVCDQQISRTHIPLLCNFKIPWKCHPPSQDNNGTGLIPVWKHLQLRLERLQQQYPELFFDVTLFTSIWTRSNADDPILMRWMSYRVDKSDITIVIRGRNCEASSKMLAESDCMTVLVDDYRHERTTLVTDVDQRYRLLSVMRCFAQGYMYLRILLLWLGCFKARSSEYKFKDTPVHLRLAYAWVTFFRIPGQVVVYSSWMPVLIYALAHFMDCEIIHLSSEFSGATVNGKSSLTIWTNLKFAAVQMRNIWGVATFAKAFILVQKHCSPAKWHRRFGLWSVRGGWIGWISALTILAPLPMTQQRDTRILDVQQLSPESVLPHSHLTFQSEYRSDVGAILDAKTIVEASLVVITAAVLTKGCLWLFQQICSRALASTFAASMIVSRSHYLPYSVGTLFDASCLSIYWRMRFVSPRKRSQRLSSSAKKSLAITPTGIPLIRGPSAQYIDQQQTSGPSKSSCSSCIQSRVHWGWPAAQGCPVHDMIYDVRNRSEAVWSMVRLVNLAMLTDPLVLLRLYGFGQRLFLYRVADDHCSSTKPGMLVLLPCSPSALADELGAECCRYELLDLVDSASVPWTLLLQCG